MKPTINPEKVRPIRLYLPGLSQVDRKAVHEAATTVMNASHNGISSIEEIFTNPYEQAESIIKALRAMESIVRLGEHQRNDEGRLNVIGMMNALQRKAEHDKENGEPVYSVIVVPKGVYAAIKEGDTIYSRDTFGFGRRGVGVVASTFGFPKKQAERKNLLYHLIAHELGHVFGTPNEDRTDIIYKRGLHCTNECVMQPGSDNDGNKLENLVELARQSPESTYCPACTDDIKNYFTQ